MSLAAAAAALASFAYFVKSDPGGYVMTVEMAFSPGIGLARVVAAAHEPGLIQELYENARPDEVTDLTREADASQAYTRVTTIRNYGLTTRMLFHCTERAGRGGLDWSRHCELDTGRLDGGRAMTRKTDDLRCALEASGRVSCVLDVRGQLKDFLFIPAARLTIKAKAQSLSNWGRFWAYVEDGAISTRLSNEHFDRSAIARNLAEVESNGLSAAAKTPFRFQAMARFEGPVSASAAPAGR